LGYENRLLEDDAPFYSVLSRSIETGFQLVYQIEQHKAKESNYR
jgi:hypothetical protein